MKQVIARRKETLPFGVSQDWLDMRDGEIEAGHNEEAAPTSIVRNSPIYLAQVRLNEHLRKQVAELQEEIVQLKAGGPTKKKRKVDPHNKPGRRTAEPVIIYKGVTYHSMAHIAEMKGLNQSSVSRQMTKKGIKPKLIGGIYYIPAAQAANIERRP